MRGASRLAGIAVVFLGPGLGLLPVGLFSLAFSQAVAPVTDINPGSASSCPSYLTIFEDILYFRANDSPHGTNTELWRYDGASAQMAADIRPGAEGSLPSWLTPYAGMLYFSAYDSTGRVKLWRFDGTTASLAPDPLGWKPGNPEEFLVHAGVLYFRAFASHIGIELYKFDGIQIEALDLFPGSGSSYPQHFIEYNGNLYFNAGATPGEGTELYRLDFGWKATKVTSINPGGASPESLAIYDGALYFSAYEPEHGRELWRYDGSSATLAADIVPGPEPSNPYGMTAYGDALYFSADNGVDGAELWRFEGTSAEMVANVNPTPFVPYIDPVHHSWPGDFFVFHDVLYFSADDGTHGRELWMYDGIEARMVSDIYPGPYGSSVGNLVSFQDRLLFTADDGVTGGELGGEVVYQLIEARPVAFRRGDVNADGDLDVSDPISAILNLFTGAPQLPCDKSADVDDDGSVSILDVISLLRVLFSGTSAPPAFSGACGPDLTPDRLACDAFPPCE